MREVSSARRASRSPAQWGVVPAWTMGWNMVYGGPGVLPLLGRVRMVRVSSGGVVVFDPNMSVCMKERAIYAPVPGTTTASPLLCVTGLAKSCRDFATGIAQMHSPGSEHVRSRRGLHAPVVAELTDAHRPVAHRWQDCVDGPRPEAVCPKVLWTDLLIE